MHAIWKSSEKWLGCDGDNDQATARLLGKAYVDMCLLPLSLKHKNGGCNTNTVYLSDRFSIHAMPISHDTDVLGTRQCFGNMGI